MKLTFHQVLLIGLLFFVFITMTMNSNFFGSKQFFFGGGRGKLLFKRNEKLMNSNQFFGILANLLFQYKLLNFW